MLLFQPLKKKLSIRKDRCMSKILGFTSHFTYQKAHTPLINLIKNINLIIFLCFILSSFTHIVQADRDAQDQLNFANGLYLRRLYDMAIAEYKKYIAQHRDNSGLPLAYFMLGECFYQKKEYKNAIRYYKDYIQKFPAHEDIGIAHFHLAISASRLDDFDVALEHLNILLDDRFANLHSDAYYFLGLVYMQSNQLRYAIENFTILLEKWPKSPYAGLSCYHLGRLYSILGESERAIKYFKRCIDISEDSELILKARFEMGISYFGLKDFEMAKEIFQDLLKNKSLDATIRGKLLNNLIKSYFNLNDYSKVVKLYTKHRSVIEQDEGGYELSLLCARAYFKRGNNSDAKEILDRLIDKMEVQNIYRKDVVLEKVRILLSEEKYLEANKILSDNVDYRGDLGFMLLKAECDYYLGRYRSAMRWYQRLLFQKNDKGPRSEAIYGFGYSALKAGSSRVARIYFTKFISEYPNDPRAKDLLHTVVIIDQRLGLTQKGINDCLRFLKTYPDDPRRPEVMYLLGRFYTEKKEPKLAISTLRRFIKEYSEDKRLNRAYFLLGFNYKILGDIELSNRYYLLVKKDSDSAGIEGPHYLARKNLLQNFLQVKDETSVIKILDEVLTTYPQNDFEISPYFWLARKYLSLNRFKDAVKILDLAKLKDKSKWRIPEFYFLYAEAKRGTGDFDTAIASYKECITLSTNSGLKGQLFLGLGLSYSGKGRFHKALDYLKEAISVDPEELSVAMKARYYMGDVYFQMGEYKEAGRFFMMVAILYENEELVPDALYRAVVSFEKAHLAKEAKKAFSELSRRFPNHKLLKKAKEFLSKD